MPRLRNKKTGVVVNVDQEAARGLGPEWVPASAAAGSGSASQESEKKTKTSTRRSRKSS